MAPMQVSRDAPLLGWRVWMIKTSTSVPTPSARVSLLAPYMQRELVGRTMTARHVASQQRGDACAGESCECQISAFHYFEDAPRIDTFGVAALTRFHLVARGVLLDDWYFATLTAGWGRCRWVRDYGCEVWLAEHIEVKQLLIGEKFASTRNHLRRSHGIPLTVVPRGDAPTALESLIEEAGRLGLPNVWREDDGDEA